MATSAPRNGIASEYALLLDKKRDSGLSPTARYRDSARRLRNPDQLVELFNSSVAKTEAYFAHNDPGTERYYDERSVPADRSEGPEETVEDQGTGSTVAVGSLMEDQGRRRWSVLGDDALSFYFIDRELLVTQSKNLPPPDSPETIGLRMDFLLASAAGGLPIVGELKVTNPKSESPDKNPYFALIQALACASYLLPPAQMARLGKHDKGRRLKTDDGRLDVYIVTVGEPPASKPWFELRDDAERLSAAAIDDLDRIRKIAFLELAWLDKPRQEDEPPRDEKRAPRVTKRFSATSV